MDEDELRKAEEALGKVSPGEWGAECLGSEGYMVYAPRGVENSAGVRIRGRRVVVRLVGGADWGEAKANAGFIAAAPGLVRRLLDEVRRLTAAEYLCGDCGNWAAAGPGKTQGICLPRGVSCHCGTGACREGFTPKQRESSADPLGG